MLKFNPVVSSITLLREYLEGKTSLRSVEKGLHQTKSSHDIGSEIEHIAHWMDELVGGQELMPCSELKVEEQRLKAHIEEILRTTSDL